MTAARKGILKGSCVGMFKTPKLLPTDIRLPVTNKGNSTMRKARGQVVAVSSLGLSLGRRGGCRQRMQRLSLGGRGAPAQLLDPTKDPLHVTHFGHAKVLQQRRQATWIPGKEG